MIKLQGRQKIRFLLFVLLAIMGAVFLTVQKKQGSPNVNKYLSVLFIGNSYTQPLPPII